MLSPKLDWSNQYNEVLSLMGGASKGKDFEKKFKEDWQKSFSNDSTVIRLYDQMSGFKKVSKNPCDFICYSYPYQYLIECKSHYGKIRS